MVIEPYLPTFALVDHGLLHFMSDEALVVEAVLATLDVPHSGLEFFITSCELAPETEAGAAYLDMVRWTKRGSVNPDW